MSNLKALPWTENNYAGIVTHTAKSPLHDYTIRYDELERAYLIDYYERMTNEHGSEFFKSVDEAKQWAQSTHYPHKMQPYVIPDSITDIANWFKAAKPEPTIDDLCVQIGCHLEEVAELLEALGVTNQLATDDLPHLANGFKRKDSRCLALINNLSYNQRIAIVDACCDTNVTGTGVMQLLGGVDVLGAQREVIRSNNSKMVKGRFQYDENGKMKKGESYSAPDLTLFVSNMKNLHKGE